MTKDLGTSVTPAAARSVRPPWRDARLWIGVALVATSIAVGARVMAGADDMTRVWAARADLQPGAALGSDDLVIASVRLDAAAQARYLRADAPPPDHQRLLRAVGEGELIPAAALGAEASGVVSVPLSVPGGAAPPSLAPGAVVDVWVTSGDRGEAASPVLDDVVVLEVPATDDVLGAGGDREVVVGVPATARDGVGRVLAAARDGRVSLTREG
ncbi:hypothetical protein [Nocardioides jejuensis]|uniref:SAF domain-containing protein n=1 Tax=Nocardioides jejuensis TaxID=2502782 RepID=A0A4V2NXG3_9ACTN|nr:hypothetical protein [Nocardioides jejuensis]TCJ21182.1 hypothetical protein EPD65_15620 [Nocardioides jejuensis]